MSVSQEEVKAPNSGNSILVNDEKPLTVAQVNLLLKLIKMDFESLNVKINTFTSKLINDKTEEWRRNRYSEYGEQGLRDAIGWLKNEIRKIEVDFQAKIAETGYSYKYEGGRPQIGQLNLYYPDHYKAPSDDVVNAEIAGIRNRANTIQAQLKVAELSANRQALLAGLNKADVQTLLNSIPRADDIFKQITGETTVPEIAA